jgi:hypothetical protein
MKFYIKLVLKLRIMSQDEKKDKDKSEKKTSEEENKTTNKIILSVVAYSKAAEATMEIGKIATESMKKMMDSIAMVNASAYLASYKRMQESMNVTMMAIANSIKIPVMNPELVRSINEVARNYSEINSIIGEAKPYLVRKDNLNTKMEGTMRAQNAYIEALERELKSKEEEVRELKERLEETKRKNELAV